MWLGRCNDGLCPRIERQLQRACQAQGRRIHSHPDATYPAYFVATYLSCQPLFQLQTGSVWIVRSAQKGLHAAQYFSAYSQHCLEPSFRYF